MLVAWKTALRPEATTRWKTALRPEDTGSAGPAGYGVECYNSAISGGRAGTHRLQEGPAGYGVSSRGGCPLASVSTHIGNMVRYGESLVREPHSGGSRRPSAHCGPIKRMNGAQSTPPFQLGNGDRRAWCEACEATSSLPDRLLYSLVFSLLYVGTVLCVTLRR
jgi:hypothetical protein